MTQGHILIVDDDEILSGLLQLTLELEGYTVDTAANGEIGLAKMREVHFDLVLLDLVMPRVDGVKFLRLRKDDGGPMPPVIIISSTSGEEVAGLPAEMGVLGFLRKPVEPARLVKQVEKALAGAPLDCA
jgi:DNA-binding response OmpR family regulator